MNNGTYLVSLGADPETIKLGEKEGRKLRCAEKARGKKNVTRWFNAIVTGYDTETADKLRKGDTLIVMGEMGLEEYKPKQQRYKGEMKQVDVMNFAKIFQVVKSPTFFAPEDETPSDVQTTTDGLAEGGTDALAGDEDPLAGV